MYACVCNSRSETRYLIAVSQAEPEENQRPLLLLVLDEGVVVRLHDLVCLVLGTSSGVRV